jgi:hypothetical protein
MKSPRETGDVENILMLLLLLPITTNGGRRVVRNPHWSLAIALFPNPATMCVQHSYDRRIFWLMLKYDWFHLFLRSLVQAMATLLEFGRGMIFDICCYLQGH